MEQAFCSIEQYPNNLTGIVPSNNLTITPDKPQSSPAESFMTIVKNFVNHL